METKAALTPPMPEPSTPPAPPSMTVPGSPAGGAAVSADKAKPAQADGPQPWDLRLVIEQDDATGTYVYKKVDRRTGETVQQRRDPTSQAKHGLRVLTIFLLPEP
ncbi:MAG: hypothetical protein JF570_06570 [Caulobacter sp.]|nr:hypothetical protein [Caulobacter sp.]